MAKGSTTQFNIELHKNRKGEFYFKKIADNREQISKSSESYTTKAKALHGLKIDALITINNINAVVTGNVSLAYVDKTAAVPVETFIIIKEEEK